MIIKLISLALFVIFLTTGNTYSEDKFLFPKKKPSVFKKINNTEGSVNLKNLPQRKPIIQIDDQKDEVVKSQKTVKKKEPTIVKRERGLVAAFPSYALHRVTPVTRGIRKTIVVWVSGPPFK